jgi:hypothetical protein
MLLLFKKCLIFFLFLLVGANGIIKKDNSIAPGISLSYQIKFFPSHLTPFTDNIIIQTEEGKVSFIYSFIYYHLCYLFVNTLISFSDRISYCMFSTTSSTHTSTSNRLWCMFCQP